MPDNDAVELYGGPAHVVDLVLQGRCRVASDCAIQACALTFCTLPATEVSLGCWLHMQMQLQLCMSIGQGIYRLT